jgi:hypothetical protein
MAGAYFFVAAKKVLVLFSTPRMMRGPQSLKCCFLADVEAFAKIAKGVD